MTDVFSTTSEKMDFPAFFSPIQNKKMTVQEINSAYFGSEKDSEFGFECEWQNSETKASAGNLISVFRTCQAVMDIYIFQCKNRELLMNHFDKPRVVKLEDISKLQGEKFLGDRSLGREWATEGTDLMILSGANRYEDLLSKAKWSERTVLTFDKYFAYQYQEAGVVLVEC